MSALAMNLPMERQALIERIERRTLSDHEAIRPLSKLAPFVAILADAMAMSSHKAHMASRKMFPCARCER